MTQIQDDPGRGVAPLAAHRRRRRIALVAAAVAAFGLTAALVVGGSDDAASANTAVRADDEILITIYDGNDPEALEQRLNDLGVPAIVDFLEGHFYCDEARSTDWVDPAGEVMTDLASPPDAEAHIALHPDVLRPGETMVLEFTFVHTEPELEASLGVRVADGPVGECEPVPGPTAL